jgi:hypothetical protein
MKSYNNLVRNEFYRDAFICVDLVEIQLYTDAGTAIPQYFNNGGMNLNATSTLTGSDVVYTAQGDFIAFSSFSETMDTKVGQFQIQLTGLNTDLVNKISLNNTEGRKVIIKKAFLNPSTFQIIDVPIEVYTGYIFNFAVTENSKTVSLNLTCSNLFSDFERTNGRRTNNWSNWLFQGVKYDKCMDKAGYVGQSEFLWGRLAK